MLANISVNSPFHNEIQFASPSRNKLCSIINYVHGDHSQSVFLNNVRIILPVKEYSNKFLRDHKPRDDVLYNHCVFKPKKSMICMMRKQIKYRKNRSKRSGKCWEKEGQHYKTECSESNSFTNSTSYNYEKEVIKDEIERMIHTPVQKSAGMRNKIERMSTSRALGMYSKVFKNENMQRMIIRKQVVNKTTDVHVKQLILQDKTQKKTKLGLGTSYANFNSGGLNKKINFTTPYSMAHKPVKNKRLFMEDENFQLAGW